MLLTEEQIQAAENGMDPNNVGGARGLSKSRKWPNGIVPYTLDSSAGDTYICIAPISVAQGRFTVKTWKKEKKLEVRKRRVGVLFKIIHPGPLPPELIPVSVAWSD